MSTFTVNYAWPDGDLPGAIAFVHRPTPALTQALRSVLAAHLDGVAWDRAELTSLTAATTLGAAIGGYRLTDGLHGWFVRVTSHIGRPEVEKALVDGLSAAGVAVNPILLAGLPLVWQGRQLRVDVRPLVTARHFDGGLADLAALGRALGRCHPALRTSPVTKTVLALTAVRNARLAGHRDRLATALADSATDMPGLPAAWMAANRPWLEQLVTCYRPDWHLAPDAQVLHGEVHQGNVLFDGHGEALLVDFEESTDVFAPPAWDLAYAVQRYCLTGEPDRDVFRTRVAALADGYGMPLPPLVPWMRRSIWHCIATIIDLRIERAIVTGEAELDKFVRLERQAIRLEQEGWLD